MHVRARERFMRDNGGAGRTMKSEVGRDEIDGGKEGDRVYVYK